MLITASMLLWAPGPRGVGRRIAFILEIAPAILHINLEFWYSGGGPYLIVTRPITERSDGWQLRAGRFGAGEWEFTLAR